MIGTPVRHGGSPAARSAEDIARSLAAVRARIVAACARAGRDPAEVRLLPVSKTVEEARIRMAHAAGFSEFGENKVQEAREKAEVIEDPDGYRIELIEAR